MRHNRKVNHLGRKSGHRKAMLSNMASSLILNKRIETTEAKAKALKPYVEPLITKSKEDTTHNRGLQLPEGQERHRRALPHDRSEDRRPSGRIPPYPPHRFPQRRRFRDGASRAGGLQRGRPRRPQGGEEEHPPQPFQEGCRGGCSRRRGRGSCRRVIHSAYTKSTSLARGSVFFVIFAV